MFRAPDIKKTMNIKALAQIGDSSDRRSFQVLRLTPEKVISTDGYILGWIENNGTLHNDSTNFSSTPFAKMSPKDAVTPSGEILTSSGTITPNVSDETFPDVDQIFNQLPNNTHLTVGLGLSVLESIVKVMKTSKTQTIALSFSDDPVKPIKAVLRETDINLVVMPWRL